MAEGQFSVCQFFADGEAGYEFVAHHVDVETAVKKAKFFTTNVSAVVGLTNRVIITDGLDHINWEWIYGKGVVYPPQE